MKKIYKIILSFTFVVLINTFVQTNSYGHGVLSAIAIFLGVVHCINIRIYSQYLLRF